MQQSVLLNGINPTCYTSCLLLKIKRFSKSHKIFFHILIPSGPLYPPPPPLAPPCPPFYCPPITAFSLVSLPGPGLGFRDPMLQDHYKRKSSFKINESNKKLKEKPSVTLSLPHSTSSATNLPQPQNIPKEKQKEPKAPDEPSGESSAS